jgi:hypothetical protein
MAFVGAVWVFFHTKNPWILVWGGFGVAFVFAVLGVACLIKEHLAPGERGDDGHD